MQCSDFTRGLLAAVSAVVLTSIFAISTFAAPLTPTGTTVAGPKTGTKVPKTEIINGMPSITSNSPLGYYIWRDPTDDRIHVATHGPGDAHHFVARLHSKGTFENIDASKLEPGDTYKVLDGGHTLMLDFQTHQATDDIAFTATGGTMKFDLKLDGTPIPTSSIYIGERGRNPSKNPFHIKL